MRARASDMVTQMQGISEYARTNHVTISQAMEDEDPTEDYGADALGVDTFGRVLREMGIRTVSIPEIGIQASTVQEFGKDANSAIAFGEWLERRKREAQLGARVLMAGRAGGNAGVDSRAIYTSADQPVGTTLNQIAFDMQPYFLQIAPAVPIAEVIAKTTTIVGSTYEAFFLTDVTAQKRYVRVTEAADIPAVKLTGGNHSLRVHKFGRRLDASYEQLRRMAIDLLALHIQRMMVQAEVDKLAAIIDVIVNGDASGSSNSATVYTLTSLDPSVVTPSVAGLTLRAYLTFKAKFRNPYVVTTLLGQENAVIQTQLMSTGSANIPLQVLMGTAGNPYGGMVPINNELADNVRIGLTDDAPSNKLIGLDSRFALERIIEQGGDITETARWVQKQVQSLIMTFDETYAIIDQNALKILDLAN